MLTSRSVITGGVTHGSRRGGFWHEQRMLPVAVPQQRRRAGCTDPVSARNSAYWPTGRLSGGTPRFRHPARRTRRFTLLSLTENRLASSRAVLPAR